MSRDGPLREDLPACLVIDGRRSPLAVALVGRALGVTGDGVTPLLHPLRRLDRVAILGRATIEAEALRALADAACPVGLIDREGRLRSVLVPLGTRRTTLADALDRLAQRPDWSSRLEDWRRARIARLARFLVADPAAAARQGWAAPEALLTAAVPASRARRARLAAEARSHATLAALAALAAGGVPGRWTGTAGDPARNLVPVFGQVALWHLVRLLGRERMRRGLAAAHAADGRVGAPGSGAETMAALQSAEPHLRRMLAGELRMFHAWLLDLTVSFGGRFFEGFEWLG